MEADVSVFYVAVFRTPDCDEESELRNQLDYDNYMRVSGAGALAQGSHEFLAQDLTLDGRRLVCIYECFPFGNGFETIR